MSGVKPRRSDISSVTFRCSPPSFGPSGEGYMRLSAFGERHTVEEAVERIRERLSRYHSPAVVEEIASFYR